MRNFVLPISRDFLVYLLPELIYLLLVPLLRFRVLIDLHSGLFALLLLQIRIYLHQDLHLAEALQPKVNVDDLVSVLRIHEFLVITNLLLPFNHLL